MTQQQSAWKRALYAVPFRHKQPCKGQTTMLYIVFMNGKSLGIIESNYAFASKYWAQRAAITGNRFKLVRVSE